MGDGYRWEEVTLWSLECGGWGWGARCFSVGLVLSRAAKTKALVDRNEVGAAAGMGRLLERVGALALPPEEARVQRAVSSSCEPSHSPLQGQLEPRLLWSEMQWGKAVCVR